MTELAAIANWSVFAFALLLWVAQMLAHEAGYWFGSRRRARGGEVQAEGVGIVVSGMLGLLAFVLALTLSFANTRFSERVEGTLAEANAIGTAWLRAEAIGHIRGPEIARLLEEYAQVRGTLSVRGEISLLSTSSIDAPMRCSRKYGYTWLRSYANSQTRSLHR